jgi:hypothetical protein
MTLEIESVGENEMSSRDSGIVYIPCFPMVADDNGNIDWCYPGNPPEGYAEVDWEDKCRRDYYSQCDYEYWETHTPIDISANGEVIKLWFMVEEMK